MSPQMLEISQRLNPQTLHHVGDMRDIRLGREFDVVAIHDAINYMTTEDDLRAAIVTAEVHLNPGGLVLLAPDCIRETFTGPRVVEWTREAEDRSVTFIEYMGKPRPASTTIESVFVFVIDEDGENQGGSGPAHRRAVSDGDLAEPAGCGRAGRGVHPDERLRGRVRGEFVRGRKAT